jgi:hypothetical protein
MQALDSGYIGLATSEDGVDWKRGLDAVSLKGDRTAFAEGTDVGTVLTPNTEDWWVFDTCHVGVGDVQILNTTNIQVVNPDKNTYYEHVVSLYGSGVNLLILGLFFWGGGDFPPLNLHQPPDKSFCVQLISRQRTPKMGVGWKWESRGVPACSKRGGE